MDNPLLMDMPLSHTAALTYALLLDRAHLSQLNGWADEAGRVYLIFPVEKIAVSLKRSLSSAKNALAELSAAGLIERKRRGQFLPNLIYVKLPDGQKIIPLPPCSQSWCGLLGVGLSDHRRGPLGARFRGWKGNVSAPR